MKESLRILTTLLLLIIFAGLGFLFGRRTARVGPESTIIQKADTSSTVEAFDVQEPKLKDSTVIHHVWVKLPIAAASQDSVPASQISHPYSAQVEVPIERKVYQEDSVYRAVVSGYQCKLDSLTIYSTTTTITVHEKPPIEYRPYSWTLFPQAEVNYGAGALEMKASIGADISISENRRWRVEPEVGYRALLVNDQMLKGCYAGATIKYNLIQVK